MDNSVINNLAPSDVMEYVESDIKKQESRAAKVEVEEKRSIEEAKRLQQYIYDNANPNPLVILVIGVGMLVLLYVLYILFLKPSLTGEWYDEKSNKWKICHNKFTGELTINNDKGRSTGEVIDNLFRCNGIIGIWNYGNVVVFVDGGGLTRLL